MVSDEDCVPAKGLHERIKNELLGKKDLILAGEGGESSGSDECPSEDNFEEEEIRKVLPRLEKKAKSEVIGSMLRGSSAEEAGEFNVESKGTCSVASPSGSCDQAVAISIGAEEARASERSEAKHHSTAAFLESQSYEKYEQTHICARRTIVVSAS